MKSQRYRPLLMALFTAGSMTIGAKINFELGAVPQSAQTFFLCLTALYFAPKEVLFGQIIYLVTGLFTPVFSGTAYGVDYIFHSNATGYLISFPFAAFLLSKYGKGGDLFGTVSWCVLAHAVVLMYGYVNLFAFRNFTADVAVHEGVLKFLPGALLKSLVAGLIYWAAEKYLRKRNHENTPV